MASSTSSNVKKPVDPKSMQADIDRKLQLYGVYCGTFWLMSVPFGACLYANIVDS